MKYATYILSAIAAYASLCACANQSLETHFNDQEEDIADYASAARFVQCEFIQSVDDEGNIHYTKETVDTIAPRITHMEMSTRLTIVSGSGTPFSTNIPPHCDIASTINTPGITGSVGKWPWK